MEAPQSFSEVEQAVQRNHGCIQVRGTQTTYVVMSIEAYREMLGVDDAELAESLRAVNEGLADVDAGRTRPFRDAFADLGRHDTLPR